VNGHNPSLKYMAHMYGYVWSISGAEKLNISIVLDPDSLLLDPDPAF
jgi:hypothetical protein